ERHPGDRKWTDGCRGRTDERQRITVRRRLGDAIDSERAAHAADVLDHHRLAELRAHALREEAAEDVGRPAGGERHDQAHRLGGISLCASGGKRARGNCEGQQADQHFHACYRAPGDENVQLKVEVAVAGADMLGECPLWDERSRTLWWVDSRGPAIKCVAPGTGAVSVHLLPEAVG